MKYNLLSKKEIFLLYVFSRQISLSIDRGLLDWVGLRDFLYRIDVGEVINIIENKKNNKAISVCGSLVNRSYLSLLRDKLYLLECYLNSLDDPNETELIKLRLDIANISSYLEDKLPKELKNIPVEHFNQSIRCKSINELKNEFFSKDL